MNSETFAQFLKMPAYLYRISYQELKSLVVQYPYCQNLRYLLLKKSQLEQHADYDRNLQMAATYSADRVYLYEQMYSNEDIPANRESNVSISEEELLELKNLGALNLEPQKEVLLADTQEDTDINPTPIVTPKLTSLDFPETENSENVELLEGDIASDELPDDTDFSIEELFLDIENNNTNSDATEEGHQISEIIESEEEEENVLLENISDKNVDAEELDIIHEIDEEDISEVLPEASSDDIEDLFAEEPELKPISTDTTSLGLDTEPVLEVENTEEIADDFPEKLATIIGAVSIASLIADDEEEQQTEEKSDLFVDLEIENPEENLTTVDITDLSFVSPKSIEDEEEEFETETELISPHSSFSNWLKQFNSPQISVEIEDLDEKNEKKKVNYKYELVNGEWKQIKIKVKKKKKKSKTELIAAESVKLSKDVATETLAQLLEKQEHYAKAIKMYERLRLENPEKSDYFVERIEALQLKL